MSDFWQQVQTWQWWLSVVIVGIAIDLVSAYTKPGIDRVLGSISTAYRRRVERERKVTSDRIARWADRPEFDQVRLARINLRTQLLTAVVVCCALIFVLARDAGLVFGTVLDIRPTRVTAFLYGVGSGAMMVAVSSFVRSFRMILELEEAIRVRSRRNAAHGEETSSSNPPQ